MKKSNYKRIFLAAFWALACSFLHAQTTVNMAANGATGSFSIAPPGTCFFNFYDNGGLFLNYNNNADANVTFLPSNPATHRVQVTFNAFSLEVGYDALYIYNSDVVNTNQVPGPQGATFSGFPAGNWQNISPGTITANTGIAAVGANANEALSFRFRSDASLSAPGWSATVRQVPKATCTMTAPGNLNANTGGPGTMNCYANVNTALPSFNPGGCESGYTLQYRINGGAPTVVPGGPTTNIQAPVGSNVITWELVDPCGNGIISSANQIISVVDNTPPVFTNCPSNITLYLDGGECSKQYDYSGLLHCSDNCLLNVMKTVNAGFNINNGQAGIMFDVANLSANPITVSQFGPSMDPGSWPVEVYFTNSSNTYIGHEQDPAAWTKAGGLTVMSTGSGVGTAIPGYGITIPAGQTLGIYITSSVGAPLRYSTALGQVDDGTLRILSPARGKGYPFAGNFSNCSYRGFITYASGANMVPVQTSGLPSGGEFPIGVTTNSFTCSDGVNSVNCSFTVTVLEYPNPIWTLVCDDLVSIALGDDCTYTVGADDVLEGGPYRCYDFYVVEIDKIPPFGNGPWVPPILTAADIGKTYKARVTEPITGNRCSGDIKIIDGRPPKMDCNTFDVTIPCNMDTDPLALTHANMTLRYPVSPVDFPDPVLGNVTREYSIPVHTPPGVTVKDVDFRTKITGNPFMDNLHVEVESPSGTIVTVFNKMNGCAPSPLFVRFDDEGVNSLNCSDFTTDQHTQIPMNLGSLSLFDNEPADGTWKIRISNVAVPGLLNVANVELAELYITMNGMFGTGFPNGISPLLVTPIGPKTYSVPAGLIDNCSPVTLSYFDQVQNQNCASIYSAIINRRWTAVDQSGNTATCVQIINLLRATSNDVTPPPNYDDVDLPGFMCEAHAYPSPDWINSQGLQGYPLTFGLPDNCDLNWTYSDQKVPICSGSYDVLRTWTIIDPCYQPQTTNFQQLIHVRDTLGPTFVDCPTDMIETTDPFTCCATFNLPDILVHDNCSNVDNVYALILTINPYTGDTTSILPVDGGLYSFPGDQPNNPDTLAAFGHMPCIPLGDHIVVYFAQDDCGNIGTCSFHLTVADYSPPQPACDETTVVSIGVDDPFDCYFPNPNGCEFAGITWVHAQTFDDGSYDQCSPIKFTIRRAPPYSDCIKALDQTPCGGASNHGLSEYEIATQESDSIKFYCCEVGTTQMVILRVYQLNYDGSISTYPDGTPIFNECQVQVTVQDKLKPVCESPFNVTVSCDNFDPSLWIYGKPKVYDNCCLDATKEYQGQKGLTHSVNYSQFDTICNKGTILRTFRVFDCHGLSSQCTQRIVVNYNQNYYIKFPDDKIITVCDGTGSFGEPTFFGEDCELLGVSYQDEVFTVVPDACFKIERTWKIINWCTYNPQGTCINVPNPTPNSNLNHITNMPGPIVSPVQTPGDPWKSTIVKVYPTDAQATNYSIYWDPAANCYTYKQIIKIIDTQAPIIECPTSPQDFCDLSNNNPQLWNETYWWDPALQTHDLCEGPVDLNINATDLCSGSNLSVRYLLLLDLDGDGVMETVISSSNPPAPGTVNYNNVNSQNFSGGTVRNFDERNVTATQKFKFALQTTVNGTSLNAAVRWNTQSAPNTYALPELPYGTHKIKWIVGDGCGNEAVCEYTFVVHDCKPPTVTCTNGLTINMMPTGMIMVFASDFLVNAIDNCTPADQLVFGIRKAGTGTGFPVDANGQPIISLTFDCNELGTQPIELWAMDAAGNADYCTTYIIVQDNAGNCVTNMATVSGALKTEGNDGLEDCDVSLSGQNPAGPAFNMFDMTDKSGLYDFNHSVPVFSDYEVMPTKDDNPLNGVTTYDLVLISKHILGIQPLGSPYKMIAADANRSNSITTLDIVELRKLILGIYQDLPNNTSWRFVDKQFNFANPANPFGAPFPESKTVGNIQTNNMDEDFVAIKIGDVNNTAVANSLMSSDDRSAGTLVFDVDDRDVKAGEPFEVKFKASEQVKGYQFTLNYNDLELVDVVTPDNMKADNFAIFPTESALTTSWNGDGQAEFTLKFRARRAGQVSKMLTLSSRITKAEAYRELSDNKTMEPLGIALRFNGKEGSVLTGIGFELYQNQPNPFVNRTTIGFHLPEATTARLTVYDQSGRLVYSQKGDFAKGYNYFTIDKSMLNTNGVLYYTVETNTDAATKSMVQIK